MRVIIAAITLIFVIGAVAPMPAEARAPRKVEKWGCNFRAMAIWAQGFPGEPVMWGGTGRIRGCDRKQAFIVRLAIFEHIPGAADRAYNRTKYVSRLGPGAGKIYAVSGGDCAADGSPPTQYPTYLRMKVVRKGKPGVVRVASRSYANPCHGLVPLP